MTQEEIQLALNLLRTNARQMSKPDFDSWLASIGVNHKLVEGFHIFDYSTIEVDWSNPVPHICRGLVLDADWNLACLGLIKFFNAEEGRAADLGDTIFAYEKLDGSCLNRWWDSFNGEWRYSTRFNMGAGLELFTGGIFSERWSDVIVRAFSALGEINQPRDEVWTFELCSLANRVVVRHPETHAKLLAIRSRVTLAERHVDEYPFAVKRFEISNLAQAQEFVRLQPGAEFEGLVLVDSNWNRVKCKNPGYVWLHHMRDKVVATWRGMAALIQRNEVSEFCAMFPDFTEVCALANNLVERECEALQAKVDHILASGASASAKEFAIAVSSANLSYPDYAFRRFRGGERDAKKFIFGLTDSRFIDWAEKVGVRSAVGSVYETGASAAPG